MNWYEAWQIKRSIHKFNNTVELDWEGMGERQGPSPPRYKINPRWASRNYYDVQYLVKFGFVSYWVAYGIWMIWSFLL